MMIETGVQKAHWQGVKKIAEIRSHLRDTYTNQIKLYRIDLFHDGYDIW